MVLTHKRANLANA